MPRTQLTQSEILAMLHAMGMEQYDNAKRLAAIADSDSIANLYRILGATLLDAVRQIEKECARRDDATESEG